MKHFLLVTFVILFFHFSLLGNNVRDTLIILNTTDIHGTILPYDYIKDEPQERGLTKIFSRIKHYRDRYDNVILVDSGDLLQGTPYAYYYNHMDTTGIHPIIQSMNFMEYDAFAVGNHDIEVGYDRYVEARTQSDYPWLSANAELEDGTSFFDPYTIVQRNGIKIGILGLTTPGIPTMLDASYYPGMTWMDMVKSAQKYTPQLIDSSDVIIGIFHAGYDVDEDRYKEELFGLPVANATGLVADRVPGFDVVFGGHSHRIRPADTTYMYSEATMKMISGARAHGLGVAQIILEQQHGCWKVVEKKGWYEPADEFPEDQELCSLNRPYHEKVIEYFRTPIAINTSHITTENARFEDNPIPQLINQVQLAQTGADISFSPIFTTRQIIPADTIHIKDVYAIYPYENTLKMIEMTGQNIRDYLEYCANYFILNNDTLKTNPEIAGYNYDMAEGISYEIDVRETRGNRIKNVIFLQTNEPIDPETVYTVAMNSYRANGGGGHIKAIGIEETKVLYASDIELRDMIVDYLKDVEIFEASVDNNWRIIK